MRLVIVTTDPLTADRLMEGQLSYLQSRGFEVTVISSPGPALDAVAAREGVRTLGVPMRRNISPVRDLLALVRLTRAVRRARPDVVSAGTPKAGLLGTIAARLGRVPVIVYHVRGLRFETARGLTRQILIVTEHVSAACAHRVFCNGESLRAEFVALKCAPVEKTFVPADGTSNGVDVARFERSTEALAWSRDERLRVGFDAGSIVVGFVGRFTRDKGIADLAEMFRRAGESHPELRLLLVGDFDATDPVDPMIQAWLLRDPRVVITGFIREPAPYYAMMDVFAFPSHREGFPNAPLEAAAASLPIVGFRATGTVDAVVDGATGTLVDVGDAAGLTHALEEYIRRPALRRLHGEAGRLRVRERYRREIVWSALADEYARLAAQTNGSIRSQRR